MKTCTKCKESKDELEFYTQLSVKNGRIPVSTCKLCDNKKNRKGYRKHHPEKPVRPDGKKICVTCGELKEAGCFSKQHRVCKECRNKSDREKRAALAPEVRKKKDSDKNKGRSEADTKRNNIKRRMKKTFLAWKYGITLEDFNRMSVEQGGLCAICKQIPEGKGLCVDHDHTSGAIRGLLCFRCNLALGGFQDSFELLRSAARYLRPRP